MGCSKNLDRIDKIFISLTFIIVTFICIFNTFCYANENIETVLIDGIRLDTSAGVTKFNSSTVGSGFYFEPIKGHTYLITNNYIGTPSNFAVSLMNLPDIPFIGYETTEIRRYLNPGNSYEYKADNDTVVCIFIQKNSNASDLLQNISVMDITPVGLKSVVGNLSLNVGLSQIWTVFETSIPYILVVVIFSLGVWFITHNIIEHSKGRDF